MLAAIGGIIALIGFIAIVVFWIMTLIKEFKSGDTVWGVLSIFFPILAPIWCFIKGHKSLGMKFVFAIVAYIVGFIIMGVGGGFQINMG